MWIRGLVYKYKSCSVTINPLMTFSLLHCICFIFFLMAWLWTLKGQGLKWPQLGLARWLGLAGTMLTGLLRKHSCICSLFNTLIHTKQTTNHAYDTQFFPCKTCQLKLLTNMCRHACLMQSVANTYVGTFLSANRFFWHAFKAFDHVRKSARNDSVTLVWFLCAIGFLNS